MSRKTKRVPDASLSHSRQLARRTGAGRRRHEPFNLGRHEADQLARVIDAIEDKRDVEDLVDGLLDEEDDG